MYSGPLHFPWYIVVASDVFTLVFQSSSSSSHVLFATRDMFPNISLQGPEVTVLNKGDGDLILIAGQTLDLVTDPSRCATSCCLPVSYAKIMSAVRAGDKLYLGQYLATGSETSSVYMDVESVDVPNSSVRCRVINDAVMSGNLLTLRISTSMERVMGADGSPMSGDSKRDSGVEKLDLPSLTERDRADIATFGKENNVDFVSLSFTQDAAAVQQQPHAEIGGARFLGAIWAF